MTYSDKPSYQYLFWLNAQLEQFIKEQGHTEEEILAYLTNSLNPTTDKEPTE
jgi:hypothetical protein